MTEVLFGQKDKLEGEGEEVQEEKEDLVQQEVVKTKLSHTH